MNKYNKKNIIGVVCFEIPVLIYIYKKYTTQKTPNKYETELFLSNKKPEKLSNRKYKGINKINSLGNGGVWKELKFIF
tara:strand:+ start:47 stop:280 length:234 start_codon:yes stop_codon:yes gene_type:complete